MRTESQVNTAIRNLRRNYEEANRNNRALDAKISELKTARSHAKSAKNQAERAYNSIRKYKVPEKWRGSRRKSFDSHKEDTLVKRSKTFMNRIDDMIEEIDREIRRLKSQQNPFVKIISAFDSSLKRLQRELGQIQQASSGGGSR